jgi:phosphoribosylformylglycinamidine (FGAM) synthase PurS component
MKTYIINDEKEVLGHAITHGLVFRRVNKVNEEKTSKVLFLEVSTVSEDKALKELLNELNLIPIVIGNKNEASQNGKKVGVFKQVESNECTYLDNTTGKRFSIC